MNGKVAVIGSIGVLLVGLAAVSGTASAASLSIVTATPQLAFGDSLTVTIQGIGFDSATSGGDFSVIFDNAALAYVSGNVNSPFDTIAIQNSSLDDASAGAMSPLRVDVFRTAAGDAGSGGASFDAATLNFNVLAGFGAGTTLQLASSLVGWFDPTVEIQYDVDYGSLQIQSVAPVPAPAALWLLATGVGALAMRKWRANTPA